MKTENGNIIRTGRLTIDEELKRYDSMIPKVVLRQKKDAPANQSKSKSRKNQRIKSLKAMAKVRIKQ